MSVEPNSTGATVTVYALIEWDETLGHRGGTLGIYAFLEAAREGMDAYQEAEEEKQGSAGGDGSEHNYSVRIEKFELPRDHFDAVDATGRSRSEAVFSKKPGSRTSKEISADPEASLRHAEPHHAGEHHAEATDE